MNRGAWLAFSCLLTVLLFGACHGSGASNKLTKAIDRLSFDLTMKLYEPGKNTFASAFSVSTALSMLYAASCGSSVEELRKVLHLDKTLTPNSAKKSFKAALQAMENKDTCPYKLDTANAVFLANAFPVRPEYTDMLLENYRALVENVDFGGNGDQATKTINSFVNNATRGMIPQLLDQPLDSATVIFLVNAIYFQGTWVKTFNPQLTREEEFGSTNCANNGVSKKAKIMYQTSYFKYLNSSKLGAELLEIPYRDACTGHGGGPSSLRMIVILPHDKCGFDEWLRPGKDSQKPGLRFEAVSEAARDLNSTLARYVTLALPRFQIDQSYDLLETLDLPVSTSGSACFNISASTALAISKIVHKAKIKVDEEGTEAAAATGVGMVPGSALIPPEPIKFLATRPFAFAIAHHSTILFHGVFTTPDSS